MKWDRECGRGWKGSYIFDHYYLNHCRLNSSANFTKTHPNLPLIIQSQKIKEWDINTAYPTLCTLYTIFGTIAISSASS